MNQTQRTHLPGSMLRLITGSILCLILLLILGGYSYHYFSESHQARSWVEHTHRTIANLESLQGSIDNIESNPRGYILYKDPKFIKLYQRDKEIIFERLKKLENNLSSHSPLIPLLPRLKVTIDERLKLLDHFLDFQQVPHVEDFATIIQNGQEKMEQIGEQLDSMQSLELKLLSQRLDYAESHARKTEIFILVFIALTQISLLLFAYFNYQDLKRRYRIEEDLRLTEKEAQSANKTKSDFLANMSHEIRTPLNSIVGMADLLIETPLTAEQKKYVQIFQRSGQDLLNLINDILDLSKVEAGQLDLDNAEFSLTNILDQISDLVATKAHQKGIEFTVLIEPDLPEFYIGDSNRIRQIILNLVNNSIKFTEKGEVVIWIKRLPEAKDPNRLLIEVSDTGIGMTREQTKRVFERFTQADKKITTKFGGTGLGLSISKKLVELMGGNISVESEFGIGTKMKIELSLPLSKESSQLTRIDLITQLSGLKALIVDDNNHNRLILQHILNRQDVNFDEAMSGEDALLKIDHVHAMNGHYDFILIDSRLPDVDGFILAKKIHEKNIGKQFVIIMLTSDQRLGDIHLARGSGIEGYIAKPISYKEFSGKLYSIIRQKEDHENMTLTKAKAIYPSQKILVVDDNHDNRMLIDAYLKDAHFNLFMAGNGLEALDLFKNNTFDLVLMDIQMPVMDGLEATRQIRDYEKAHGLKQVPIFALSAYALKEEKEKSLNAGCNMHLSKPIKKAELLNAIQSQFPPEETDHFITAKVDPELYELAMTYLQKRKEEIPLLKKYLQDKDYANLSVLGHKMRGVAESYGFDDLTKFGGELELAAKASLDASISSIVAEIEVYLASVRVVQNQNS